MKTRLLLPALALLFVLSSCSNVRFGHVPKVKAKKQTAVAQKSPEKKNITAPEVIESKKQPATDVVANYEIPGNSDFLPATPLKSTDKTTAPKTMVTKPTKADKTNSLQEILSPKQLKKLKKAEKMTATKKVEKGSWLWFIIVGLVLILIAVILPIPVLNWLIYVIGVILIIYGLLMFLDIV